MIEGGGVRVPYLPAYSPDLNPIEEAISKVKGMLRSAEARAREALDTAISEALDAITREDALGYFAHSGHLPAHQPL